MTMAWKRVRVPADRSLRSGYPACGRSWPAFANTGRQTPHGATTRGKLCAWTDANGGAGVVPPTLLPIVAGVAVIEVQPGSHIDLGLGRSDERSSREHR